MRPYDHNPVQVIGHHHPGIKRDVRTDIAGPQPFPRHHPPHRAQLHLAIHQPPEDASPLERTHRHVVHPRLRVVVVWQTD